jgi:DNA-directed RNA polymerase specialized sigma24 family protein
MSEGDRPEVHGVPAVGPVLDPRAAKARYRQRTRPSAGLVYLRELTAREWTWMVDMTARVARMHHVDADDLMQDLALSLLECDALDSGRTEVRSWLRNRARWRALDILRRSHGPVTACLDADDNSETPAPEPTRIDLDWSVQRLVDLGLNRSEAQAVLLQCWNLDISMRDFAELADRSYAAVRQDRSRGLRKIENLFGLDEAESAALVACRDHGARAAAHRLGIEIGELRALVSRAERKIDRALRRGPTNPTTEDEDDSDAC